jgi:hypothetical protein
MDESLDAPDASCDPGVPGVRCLTRAPSGSQILSLIVDDTKVYFSQIYFVDSGEPLIEPLLAASRATGQVTTLAPLFPTEPQGLLKDDASVYSAQAGVVSRVALDGGSVQTIPLPDAGYANCLAFDGDFVVVSGDGAFLDRVPKSGGLGVILAPPENDDGPGAATVLDGRAYFSAQSIYSIAVDGGAVENVIQATSDGGSFASWCRSLLTKDGSLISFHESSDFHSSIVVLPLGGGAMRSLDTAFIDSIGISFAVSSHAVYSLGVDTAEIDAGLSHVVRTPLDGGPAESLATVPIDGPSGSTFQDIALASDGTLYWNTFDRILYMKVE